MQALAAIVGPFVCAVWDISWNHGVGCRVVFYLVEHTLRTMGLA